MTGEWKSVSLESLGALRVRGRDAVSFLQGQLSGDLARLAADRSLLAGYHNPEGRVLALMRLLALAPEDLLALLPRELVAPTAARLSKYVLRSKVAIADDSAAWRIGGLIAPDSAPGAPSGGTGALPGGLAGLPGASGAVARLGGTLAVRAGETPARWLLVAPLEAGGALELAAGAAVRAAPPVLWRRLAIANGEPQVYAATSGEFVAQMLNLDVLGAIAFDKGCYTGQEVIARAHYRGRVKRRLQRFRSPGRVLEPGEAAELSDGRAVRVVDAVPLEGGGCEFLAVAPLGAAVGAAGGEAAAADGTPRPRLDAVALALPYALPA
jgi:tRNA-modifying protein YgfZ